MASLEVRLLGAPALHYDGRALKLPTPLRCVSLLALIVMRRGEPAARTQLAATLWPDDLDADARANLRRHLHILQSGLPKVAGVEWIHTTPRTVGWNAGAPAWIDIRAFEDGIADSAHRNEAIELYRGELLATSYDEALFADRERLRGLYEDACFDAAMEARSERRFREAIGYAERILDADEWREDALRLVMTLRYESGDRSSALTAFERFAARLSSEMKASPMPETLALRDAMLTNSPLAASRASAEDVAGPMRSARTPFVGRQVERATLDAAWRHAARGRGTVLFVGGEAGIGKSRLVDEFAASVGAQGGRTLLGETSNPQAYPYEPLVDALRRGLALIVQSPPPAPWLSAIADVLPELRGAFPDAPPSPSLDASGARTRLYEAFARTIERLARARPLLLVLEDVHWAQSATLEALEAVASRIGGVPALIVATYRTGETGQSHPLAGMRRRLIAARQATSVELHPLGAGEIAELVEKTPQGSGELARAVYAGSDGNPLFAGLLLRNFAETGELPDVRSASPSISQTILARTQSLDADALALAETASVAGGTFAVDVLASVLGWRENEVLDALGTLLDRAIVRTSGSSAFAYAFSHALMETAIYSSLDPAERAVRHRRIAAVLAQSGGDAQTLGSIARHWRLGGEPDRARAAYLEAARAALAVYARAEASANARAAYELSNQAPARFEAVAVVVEAEERSSDAAAWLADLEILRGLAESLGVPERYVAAEAFTAYYSQTGERSKQRAEIDRMLQLSETLGALRRGAALYQLSLLHMQMGRLSDTVAPSEEALTIAAAEGDPVLEARCRRILLQAFMRLGNLVQAKQQLAALHDLAVRVSSTTVRAEWLYAELQYAAETVDVERTLRFAGESLDLALSVGDLHGEIHARYSLGFSFLRKGPMRSAREQLESALETSRRLGYTASALSMENSIAVCDVHVGLIDRALRRYEELVPALEAADANMVLCVAQFTRSEALLVAGEAERAVASARAALQYARSARAENLIAASLLALGTAHCGAKREREGLGLLEEAVIMRRKDGPPSRTIEALASYLDALVDADERERAARVCAELYEAFQGEGGSDVWRPWHVLSVLARAAQAAGDVTAARAHAQRGRRLLEEQIARFDDAEVAQSMRALPYNAVLERLSR
jgi:DNA-binding SARP family transcriptional activator